MAYMAQKDLTNTVISAHRAGEITDGVNRVVEAIDLAAEKYGRKSSDITLVAATKTRDVGEIMAALRVGVRAIAENRVQEVVAKAQTLAQVGAEEDFCVGVLGESCALGNSLTQDGVKVPFTLIGQLQSNKINKVLPLVNAITSVDSLNLAQKIAKRCEAQNLTMNVMLEVNESGEESKSGCSPQAALDEALQIAELKGLKLCGLMTMGARDASEAQVRESFAHLRGVRDAILESEESGTEECAELSMGMSGDFEYAIAEGATIVRIGSAIFGPRAFV